MSSLSVKNNSTFHNGNFIGNYESSGGNALIKINCQASCAAKLIVEQSVDGSVALITEEFLINTPQLIDNIVIKSYSLLLNYFRVKLLKEDNITLPQGINIINVKNGSTISVKYQDYFVPSENLQFYAAQNTIIERNNDTTIPRIKLAGEYNITMGQNFISCEITGSITMPINTKFRINNTTGSIKIDHGNKFAFSLQNNAAINNVSAYIGIIECNALLLPDNSYIRFNPSTIPFSFQNHGTIALKNVSGHSISYTYDNTAYTANHDGTIMLAGFAGEMVLTAENIIILQVIGGGMTDDKYITILPNQPSPIQVFSVDTQNTIYNIEVQGKSTMGFTVNNDQQFNSKVVGLSNISFEEPTRIFLGSNIENDQIVVTSIDGSINLDITGPVTCNSSIVTALTGQLKISRMGDSNFNFINTGSITLSSQQDVVINEDRNLKVYLTTRVIMLAADSNVDTVNAINALADKLNVLEGDNANTLLVTDSTTSNAINALSEKFNTTNEEEVNNRRLLVDTGAAYDGEGKLLVAGINGGGGSFIEDDLYLHKFTDNTPDQSGFIFVGNMNNLKLQFDMTNGATVTITEYESNASNNNPALITSRYDIGGTDSTIIYVQNPFIKVNIEPNGKQIRPQSFLMPFNVEHSVCNPFIIVMEGAVSLQSESPVLISALIPLSNINQALPVIEISGATDLEIDANKLIKVVSRLNLTVVGDIELTSDDENHISGLLFANETQLTVLRNNKIFGTRSGNDNDIIKFTGNETGVKIYLLNNNINQMVFHLKGITISSINGFNLEIYDNIEETFKNVNPIGVYTIPNGSATFRATIIPVPDIPGVPQITPSINLSQIDYEINQMQNCYISGCTSVNCIGEIGFSNINGDNSITLSNPGFIVPANNSLIKFLTAQKLTFAPGQGIILAHNNILATNINFKSDYVCTIKNPVELSIKIKLTATGQQGSSVASYGNSGYNYRADELVPNNSFVNFSFASDITANTLNNSIVRITVLNTANYAESTEETSLRKDKINYSKIGITGKTDEVGIYIVYNYITEQYSAFDLTNTISSEDVFIKLLKIQKENIRLIGPSTTIYGSTGHSIVPISIDHTGRINITQRSEQLALDSGIYTTVIGGPDEEGNIQTVSIADGGVVVKDISTKKIPDEENKFCNVVGGYYNNGDDNYNDDNVRPIALDDNGNVRVVNINQQTNNTAHNDIVTVVSGIYTNDDTKTTKAFATDENGILITAVNGVNLSSTSTSLGKTGSFTYTSDDIMVPIAGLSGTKYRNLKINTNGNLPVNNFGHIISTTNTFVIANDDTDTTKDGTIEECSEFIEFTYAFKTNTTYTVYQYKQITDTDAAITNEFNIPSTDTIVKVIFNTTFPYYRIKIENKSNVPFQIPTQDRPALTRFNTVVNEAITFTSPETNNVMTIPNNSNIELLTVAEGTKIKNGTIELNGLNIIKTINAPNNSITMNIINGEVTVALNGFQSISGTNFIVESNENCMVGLIGDINYLVELYFNCEISFQNVTDNDTNIIYCNENVSLEVNVDGQENPTTIIDKAFKINNFTDGQTTGIEIVYSTGSLTNPTKIKLASNPTVPVYLVGIDSFTFKGKIKNSNIQIILNKPIDASPVLTLSKINTDTDTNIIFNGVFDNQNNGNTVAKIVLTNTDTVMSNSNANFVELKQGNITITSINAILAQTINTLSAQNEIKQLNFSKPVNVVGKVAYVPLTVLLAGSVFIAKMLTGSQLSTYGSYNGTPTQISTASDGKINTTNDAIKSYTNTINQQSTTRTTNIMGGYIDGTNSVIAVSLDDDGKLLTSDTATKEYTATTDNGDVSRIISTIGGYIAGTNNPSSISLNNTGKVLTTDESNKTHDITIDNETHNRVISAVGSYVSETNDFMPISLNNTGAVVVTDNTKKTYNVINGNDNHDRTISVVGGYVGQTENIRALNVENDGRILTNDKSVVYDDIGNKHISLIGGKSVHGNNTAAIVNINRSGDLAVSDLGQIVSKINSFYNIGNVDTVIGEKEEGAGELEFSYKFNTIVECKIDEYAKTDDTEPKTTNNIYIIFSDLTSVTIHELKYQYYKITLTAVPEHNFNFISRTMHGFNTVPNETVTFTTQTDGTRMQTTYISSDLDAKNLQIVTSNYIKFISAEEITLLQDHSIKGINSTGNISISDFGVDSELNLTFGSDNDSIVVENFLRLSLDKNIMIGSSSGYSLTLVPNDETGVYPYIKVSNNQVLTYIASMAIIYKTYLEDQNGNIGNYTGIQLSSASSDISRTDAGVFLLPSYNNLGGPWIRFEIPPGANIILVFSNANPVVCEKCQFSSISGNYNSGQITIKKGANSATRVTAGAVTSTNAKDRTKITFNGNFNGVEGQITYNSIDQGSNVRFKINNNNTASNDTYLETTANISIYNALLSLVTNENYSIPNTNANITKVEFTEDVTVTGIVNPISPENSLQNSTFVTKIITKSSNLMRGLYESTPKIIKTDSEGRILTVDSQLVNIGTNLGIVKDQLVDDITTLLTNANTNIELVKEQLTDDITPVLTNINGNLGLVNEQLTDNITPVLTSIDTNLVLVKEQLTDNITTALTDVNTNLELVKDQLTDRIKIAGIVNTPQALLTGDDAIIPRLNSYGSLRTEITALDYSELIKSTPAYVPKNITVDSNQDLNVSLRNSTFPNGSINTNSMKIMFSHRNKMSKFVKSTVPNGIFLANYWAGKYRSRQIYHVTREYQRTIGSSLSVTISPTPFIPTDQLFLESEALYTTGGYNNIVETKKTFPIHEGIMLKYNVKISSGLLVTSNDSNFRGTVELGFAIRDRFVSSLAIRRLNTVGLTCNFEHRLYEYSNIKIVLTINTYDSTAVGRSIVIKIFNFNEWDGKDTITEPPDVTNILTITLGVNELTGINSIDVHRVASLVCNAINSKIIEKYSYSTSNRLYEQHNLPLKATVEVNTVIITMVRPARITDLSNINLFSAVFTGTGCNLSYNIYYNNLNNNAHAMLYGSSTPANNNNAEILTLPSDIKSLIETSQPFVIVIYVTPGKIMYGYDTTIQNNKIRWFYNTVYDSNNTNTFGTTYNFRSGGTGIGTNGYPSSTINQTSLVNIDDTNYISPYICSTFGYGHSKLRMSLIDLEVYGTIKEPDYIQISSGESFVSGNSTNIVHICNIPTLSIFRFETAAIDSTQLLLMKTNRTYKIAKILITTNADDNEVFDVLLFRNVGYVYVLKPAEVTVYDNYGILLPSCNNDTGLGSSSRSFVHSQQLSSELLWRGYMSSREILVDLVEQYVRAGDSLGIVMKSYATPTHSVFTTLYLDCNN